MSEPRTSIINLEGQEEHVDTAGQVAITRQMEEEKVTVQTEKKNREFRAHKKMEDYKDYSSIPYMKPEGSKRGLSEKYISVQFGSQYDSKYIKADKNGNKDVIKEVEFKGTSNSANFPTSVNSKECEITDVRLLMSYKEDRKDLNEDPKYVIVEISKEQFVVQKKVKNDVQKHDRNRADIRIKSLTDEVRKGRLYNIFIPITEETNEKGEVITRLNTNEMKREPTEGKKLRDIKQLKKDILEIRKKIRSEESIMKKKVIYVENLAMSGKIGQEEYEQKTREMYEENKRSEGEIQEMKKDIIKKKIELRKSEIDLPGCVVLKRLADQIVEMSEYNEETGKFDKYDVRMRGIDADMLKEQRDHEERMFDRLFERWKKNYDNLVEQHKKGMEELEKMEDMKSMKSTIKGIEEYFRVSKVPERERNEKEKNFYEMCIKKYKSDKEIKKYYDTILSKKRHIEQQKIGDTGKSIQFVQRYGPLRDKVRNRKKLTPEEADWLRGNSVILDPEIGEGKYDSDKYNVFCTFKVEDNGVVKINCNVKRQGQKVGITMDMSTKGCRIFISMDPDVNEQFKNLMKYGEIEQVMYSYYATAEQQRVIRERLKVEKAAKEELEKARMEEERLAEENELIKENEEEPNEKEIRMEEEEQQTV